MPHPNTIPYLYWSDAADHDHYATASYWTHDNKKCLLRARLEGHELYRHEGGCNPDATCKICGRRFIEVV